MEPGNKGGTAESHGVFKSAKKETGEQEKAQPRQEIKWISRYWEPKGGRHREGDSGARPGGIL